MAQDVKIDCFTLQIRKYKNKSTDPDVFVGFDDIFTEREIKLKKAGSDDEEPVLSFYDFFGHYVNSFGNKFHVHKSSGKALYLNPSNTHPNITKRIISGQIEGGGTGIVSKIKNLENFSDEADFIVTDKHVSAIPFYYLLWVPERGNVGLLIVQSFSNRSITDPFKTHLNQFFNKFLPNHSLKIGSYIPKQAVKSMKEKGDVNKMILRKHRLSADKTSELFGTEYNAQNSVDIEIIVKGLDRVAGVKDKIRDFLSGELTQLIDIEHLPDLSEIGIDGTHDTILEFNHNGKTALAKKSNNFKLSISFYVNEDDIERDIDSYPTYASMHTYSLSYLQGVQQEIGIPEAQQIKLK